MNFALLFSVFVIATCGLVYELVAGTLASYLLGDSVAQFSFVIGSYLFSMGIGSFLSQYLVKNIILKFIQIELLVGLVGGISASVLYFGFARVAQFEILLYFFVGIIGILVGLEIPLLLRILKDKLQFKDLVSQVLGVDYLGALAASVLFPLFLMPRLGLVRTAFAFGIANASVALWTTFILKEHIEKRTIIRIQCLIVLVLLGGGMYFGDKITNAAEADVLSDQVIFSKSTKYQRIVLTRFKDDLRLFLNGNLQFSTQDEYRYHEALIHPALAGLQSPKKVLILGGGDGLALREVLKYSSVESIKLVDLDKEMTDLFSVHPLLSKLNARSFSHPKVKTINSDAFVWLQGNKEKFDFIAVDFPDPNSFSLGKLYTTRFYKLLREALVPEGQITVQSTSPMFARQAFWCIDNTMRSVGFVTSPYHVYVPSFGEWGFILAGNEKMRMPKELPDGLRFLTLSGIGSLFEFPTDMKEVPTEVNRLNNQVLVNYYEAGWRRLLR